MKNIDSIIADTKFNVELFNKNEMTHEEVNMIYNRSIGIEPFNRTGNMQIDHKAVEEGGAWPGEYCFDISSRNMKMQIKKHRLNIFNYLKQLKGDL